MPCLVKFNFSSSMVKINNFMPAKRMNLKKDSILNDSEPVERLWLQLFICQDYSISIYRQGYNILIYTYNIHMLIIFQYIQICSHPIQLSKKNRQCKKYQMENALISTWKLLNDIWLIGPRSRLPDSPHQGVVYNKYKKIYYLLCITSNIKLLASKTWMAQKHKWYCVPVQILLHHSKSDDEKFNAIERFDLFKQNNHNKKI